MRFPNYVQLLRRLMYSFYTPSIVSCGCGWAEHVVARCIIHVVCLSYFSACGISLYRGLTTEQGIRLQALEVLVVSKLTMRHFRKMGIRKRVSTMRFLCACFVFFKHVRRCFPTCEPPRLVQRVNIIIILLLLFCRKQDVRRF